MPAAGRRELAAAASLCAAGAGLVLLAGGQPWGRMTAASPGAGVAAAVIEVTGRQLSGVTSALGWAALAGLLALAATRGWARAGVGGLLAAFGAAIAVASVGAVRHPHLAAVARGQSALAPAGAEMAVHATSWWAVSVAGGLAVAVAGLGTAVRGRRWPAMSSRYDPPGAAAATGADPADLWRSLNRGEDPTDPPASQRGDPKEH